MNTQEQVAAQIAIEALKQSVIVLARYLSALGKDPKAEVNALLDAADITVDAAEALKFGGG